MTEFQTVFVLSTAITMTLLIGAQVWAWNYDRKKPAKQYVPVERFRDWERK